MRLPSADVPHRAPQRRRGKLRARLTGALYQVDLGIGSEWAYWEGGTVLVLGTDVTLEFDPTLPGWWIVS